MGSRWEAEAWPATGSSQVKPMLVDECASDQESTGASVGAGYQDHGEGRWRLRVAPEQKQQVRRREE